MYELIELVCDTHRRNLTSVPKACIVENYLCHKQWKNVEELLLESCYDLNLRDAFYPHEAPKEKDKLAELILNSIRRYLNFENFPFVIGTGKQKVFYDQRDDNIIDYFTWVNYISIGKKYFIEFNRQNDLWSGSKCIFQCKNDFKKVLMMLNMFLLKDNFTVNQDLLKKL